MSHTSNECNDLRKSWPADSLGKFLEDACHNMIATIANLRPWYERLAAVDRLYCEIPNILNHHPQFVAGFFLIRTRSSFRGAVHLCLSGQIPETYMVLRACLESALYGLYVADDDDRQKRWLRRHVDDASLKRVKNEFTFGKVSKHLESVDANTHRIAKLLYERTIDYGAHPNERAVMAQIETESSGVRADVTATDFLCGDKSQRAALKSSGQIGICCLDIFQNVFRDRYRILEIDKRLDQIRKAF